MRKVLVVLAGAAVLAGLLVGTASPATSEGGEIWTARSASEANSWRSVAYGNGRFVAISDDGTNQVMTSTDGITWTAGVAAEAHQWYSVTYGNGLFVAVSANGTNRVMTSPDGITWTIRSAAEANAWMSVTYGAGLFVAVSFTGTNRVMTSPDGITWTARAAAEASTWHSVTYGNGLYVAVAYSGTNRVMTSPDGITWTARAAAEASTWYSVTYGNGLYVAVAYSGTNRVMTSPDGTAWTARSVAEANPWQAVTYANGLFVALSSSGTNQAMTSPDGIAWALGPAAEANRWSSVTYGKGTFVAVSSNGTNRVMTSPGPPVVAPGAPTTVRATAGSSSATVAWSPPGIDGGSPITAYVVTPYIGGTAQSPITSSGTGTSKVVTGLSNGTQYTFRVAAVNAIGTGSQSSDSNAVRPAAVPGAPTIGSVVAGNTQATVSWTAPASDGGSPITGYVVTPSAASGFGLPIPLAPRAFDSTATSQTISGLSNGTAYTFRVAAVNAVGTGNQSSASTAVTPVGAGAPTIGTATAGDARATVSWTAPGSTGGSPITGYVVTPFVAGAAQTPQIFNSPATTQTITGLTNGTTYTFKVAAVNALGVGNQSAGSNAVTPATVPGPPVIGSVAAGDARATLTWTAPVSDGGSPITGYVVTPSMAGMPLDPRTFTSTATSQTITGLDNGTAYTFKVAATNARGTGASSLASPEVTPIGVPGSPSVTSVTAGNARATLTWTAPTSSGGSPITGYVVTPYLGTTPEAPTYFESTATTQTVTGLTNGSAYRFRVAAANALGTGLPSWYSDEVIPATVPGAPVIGPVTAGIRRVTVSWSAPVSSGGSPVTGYVVTPYVDGDAQEPATFDSTATTQTVGGLADGTTYAFTVAAINAVGAGPESAPSREVTTAGSPSSPSITSATPGNGSVTLAWSAPAANGGSPITGYVVTPYIGSAAQTAKTFNSTATKQIITGLSIGRAYTFRVAAKNAIGTGPRSAASRPATPTASISASVSPTRTAIGRTATISGTVKPGSATPSVTIERYVNGKWEYRGRATVDRTTGAFRMTVSPSQRGNYAFRARSAGGGLVSKTIYLEVYAGMVSTSGQGAGNSKPIYLSGGTYLVVGTYRGAGNCYWFPWLEGISDEYASFDLPDSEGSGTKTYLYNVRSGSYYVDPGGSNDPSCTWAMTFYRQ